MNLQSWDLVFLAGFVAYVTIRGVFIERTKGGEKVAARVDAQERVLMFLVAIGSMLLPILYLFTPWLAFADYRLPSFAPWIGAPIMVAALWLFWRSHADLGRNWSPSLEVRKGHELVKGGVYRRIRHPMYASIWLWNLAQGLMLANWLAGWGAFVAFALLYAFRAPREEAMMCEFFGQEYRDYMRETGRLLPRLKSVQVE